MGASPREWRLEHAARPVLLNAERSGHWSKRSTATAEWRTAFFWLAKEAKIPLLNAITVTAFHERKDRRSAADVSACVPSVKAGIDGLVDAGVIPDDGPEFMRELTFVAPTVTGRDALVLVVTEVV